MAGYRSVEAVSLSFCGLNTEYGGELLGGGMAMGQAWRVLKAVRRRRGRDDAG